MTTEAGQEKKAGEELFFVALSRRQLHALRQDATAASTLAHVELNEDGETFWAEIGHRLCAAKPESTVKGLVEAAGDLLETLVGIERAGEAGAMEEFEEAQHALEGALSSYKQEVE